MRWFACYKENAKRGYPTKLARGANVALASTTTSKSCSTSFVVRADQPLSRTRLPVRRLLPTPRPAHQSLVELLHICTPYVRRHLGCSYGTFFSTGTRQSERSEPTCRVRIDELNGWRMRATTNRERAWNLGPSFGASLGTFNATAFQLD